MLLLRIDRKRHIVIVLVIVIEYRARSGSLSGILALTLNPAALARLGVAGRDGNRIGTVPKWSYDNDDEYKNEHEHDCGFSITGVFWLTCNSALLMTEGLLNGISASCGMPQSHQHLRRDCISARCASPSR